jgi:hypothetical protein
VEVTILTSLERDLLTKSVSWKAGYASARTAFKKELYFRNLERLDFCLTYDATHQCGPRPPVLRVYDFVCGGVIGVSQSCSDIVQHQRDESQAYVHAPGSRIDS